MPPCANRRPKGDAIPNPFTNTIAPYHHNL